MNEQRSASGRPLPTNWLAVIAVIWTGQAASIITSSAAGYAVVWYVTETTGSAIMLALTSICAMLPMGLLSPFGGVVADRLNRRTIMIAADLSVGVVSLGLGIALLFGEISFGLILFFAMVRSVGQAFHSPAMMAAMPLLVPERHLLRINTLDQLLGSLAMIGSPALGIFLYTMLGFHTVMFLDFAGAILAVGGLLLAKIPTVRDENATDRNVMANLRVGLEAVGRNRGLAILLGAVTLGTFAFGPLSAINPLMTFDHFGGDGYMASIAEAAYGVGMIIGSGILMTWGGGGKLARLIALAALITGATTMACGMLPTDGFWAYVALVMAMAVACAWFVGPSITLIQRAVPEEKMGRAIGVFNAATGMAAPLGVAAGGALADAIGVAPFFVVDGALILVLALCYASKHVRALDAPQE